MNLNSPNTSREFSEPVKETLTKAQKAVVDRVTLILETNPELNKKVSRAFEKNFHEVVGDIDKFNLLLERLGALEFEKLGMIQRKFEIKEISGKDAIEESQSIIEHYTKAKLTVLKGNITAEKVV